MYKFIARINKTDRYAMLGIYLLSLIFEIVSLIITLTGDIPTNPREFFVIFYSFASGVGIMVTLLLIRGVFFAKHVFLNMSLLLVYAAVQLIVVLVDLIFGLLYNHLFASGYVYMILSSILSVSFVRRYFMLDYFKQMLLEHDLDGKEF
ncbi:MAG: hypothetical protein LBS74_09415 [Oscillospiraceae bacterium]|jgi:uncharacterized membrane protein|nr:hypothetical protein [Oscillospiraceae bacterium]